jgi:hypothetical protein
MSIVRKPAIIAIMMLALTGCSDKPSDGEVKSLFLDKVSKDAIFSQFKDLFEIKNFSKENAFQADAKHYNIDVAYDLTFTRGISEVEKSIESEKAAIEELRFGGSNSKILQEANQKWAIIAAKGFTILQLRAAFGPFVKGESKHLTGKLNLIKTEAGWRNSQ